MNREEIEKKFSRYAETKHKNSENSRISYIEKLALQLATAVNELCPDGREKSLAVGYIKTAVENVEQALKSNYIHLNVKENIGKTFVGPWTLEGFDKKIWTNDIELLFVKPGTVENFNWSQTILAKTVDVNTCDISLSEVVRIVHLLNEQKGGC